MFQPHARYQSLEPLKDQSIQADQAFQAAVTVLYSPDLLPGINVQTHPHRVSINLSVFL